MATGGSNWGFGEAPDDGTEAGFGPFGADAGADALADAVVDAGALKSSAKKASTSASSLVKASSVFCFFGADAGADAVAVAGADAVADADAVALCMARSKPGGARILGLPTG